MSTPRVLLLRTAGTNCDRELDHAFSLVGARVEALHINALLKDPAQLEQFQILAFPGGFAHATVPTNGLNHEQAIKLADFVLTDFTGAERKELEYLLDRTADAVEAVVTKGLEAAQNAFHAT